MEAILILTAAMVSCVAMATSPEGESAGQPAGAERPAGSGRYFVIEVVDAETKRGVPLIELKTTNQTRWFTDSAGVAAIDEPGLEDREVFFFVTGHGYEFPKDGFGYRGTHLRVKAGETARLEVRRLNIAERLYRVTGEGIYRDSALAGRPVPPIPLLNAEVVGQDTVDTAIHDGRLFWIWGDTSHAAYPLGNFHTTAATSRLPGTGGLDPDRGVVLDYFTKEDGFTRAMTPFSDSGPTWVDGLAVVKEDGRDRLFALYANVDRAMKPLERGLARFDDGAGRFERVARFDMASPILPRGHVFRASRQGEEYLYYAHPYPLVRVRADPAAIRDPSLYEAFTPLREGTRFDPSRPEEAVIERDAAGRPVYAWRPNTPIVGPGEQARLVKAGLMTPEEQLIQLRDPETGTAVAAHGGSVFWNAYRKRWILIAVESGGSSSYLGEMWYAEADTPVGPWAYGRKIATHDKYSFYNPRQHPYFDEEGGRRIYFEGTYTFTFSGSEEAATPRYDYNQVMYRLDLADPRLALPAPVVPPPSIVPSSPHGRVAPFFAIDRPAKGTIPVYLRITGGVSRIEAGNDETNPTGSDETNPAESGGPTEANQAPLFWALPAGAANPPPETAVLFEYVRKADGAPAYGIDPGRRPDLFEPSPRPVCRVWRNPVAIDLSPFAVEPSPLPTKSR